MYLFVKNESVKNVGDDTFWASQPPIKYAIWLL